MIYLPTNVSWTISNNCNLGCKFCYANSYFKNKDECISNLLIIADKLKEIGIFNITLTGGEPLLRNDIFDLISKLKKMGLSVNLNTNGTLINKEIASLLKSTGVGRVRISLDTDVEQVHDTLRGVKGSFNKSISAIKHLIGVGLNVDVATIPMKRNKNRLKYMADFLNELRISTWHFFRLINNGCKEIYESESLTPQEYKEYIDNIICISNIYKFHVSFNDPLYSVYSGEVSYGCGACKSYFAVDSIGNYRWCPSLMDSTHNILKDDFFEIWFNDESDNMRNNNIIVECKSCKHKFICGGCPSSSFSEYGKAFIKDPMCTL